MKDKAEFKASFDKLLKKHFDDEAIFTLAVGTLIEGQDHRLGVRVLANIGNKGQRILLEKAIMTVGESEDE